LSTTFIAPEMAEREAILQGYASKAAFTQSQVNK
jgi:hypothetical protein